MLRPTLLAVALTVLLVGPLLAQTPGFREVKVGDSFEIRTAAKPVYASPQSAALAPIVVPVIQADQYGIGAWLNAQRAARGLRALRYDAASSALAYANSTRGFGHFVGGYGLGQCAGWGAIGSVEAQWLLSAPHARILFDTRATTYGVGVAGPNSTININ